MPFVAVLLTRTCSKAAGRIAWRYIRKMIRALLTSGAIASCPLAQSDQLTEEQCSQIGGVLTEIGCVMAKGEDAGKLRNAKMYLPSKKECECSGGRWHEEHGCLAPIQSEECTAMGGQAHPELGCVKLLSTDQCEKLGGVVKADGGCEFQ